jgi:putative transposase
MAKAFVKTLKRDYVRVSPIANAAEALSLIDSWIEDYNTVHPHSRLGYRSPREYIMLSSQPATCWSNGVNFTLPRWPIPEWIENEHTHVGEY